MKPLSLLYFSILFVFCSCGSSSQENSNADSLTNDSLKFNSVKTPNAHPEEFEYKLPQSEYSYKIKITEVYVDTVKAAFETKKDQYSVPEKLDGYLLKLKITMTNPYPNEMMAPVPHYFFLASEDKQAVSASTTFSRDCHCQIDNSSEITLPNGKELWSVSDGKCGYDDYCLKFKANEIKTFIIRFTDPFTTSNKQIIFWGFGRKWKNPTYTADQDNGLVIDLEKKMVVSEFGF